MSTNEKLHVGAKQKRNGGEEKGLQSFVPAGKHGQVCRISGVTWQDTVEKYFNNNNIWLVVTDPFIKKKKKKVFVSMQTLNTV